MPGGWRLQFRSRRAGDLPPPITLRRDHINVATGTTRHGRGHITLHQPGARHRWEGKPT